MSHCPFCVLSISVIMELLENHPSLGKSSVDNFLFHCGI